MSIPFSRSMQRPRRNGILSPRHWTVALIVLCGCNSLTLGQNTVEDDVLYRHLFRHVAHYDVLATKTELSGKPSALRHAFRRKLSLNPSEEQDLNELAAQCMAEIHLLDLQAQAILITFHKQYPTNVPLPAGVRAPPLPSGLADLSAQRRRVALAYRNRLHVALGDQRFAEVHAVLKRTVAPEISVTTAR